MRAVTPGDLLVIAAGMMLFGGVVAWLFGKFFCARDTPRWMRWWRDLAVALMGARLIGARVFDLPLDWFSAAIYLNIGLSQAAIALYRWRHAIGAHGDRCTSTKGDSRARDVS